METYTMMRQFADSWGLLAMTLFFLTVVVRMFTASAKRNAQEAARIPFEEKPANSPENHHG